MRTTLEDNRTRGMILGPGTRWGPSAASFGAGGAVPLGAGPLIVYTGSTGNLSLPTGGPATQGMIFVIVNRGTNTATILDGGGAGQTTAITVAVNTAVTVMGTGGTGANAWVAI